MTKFKKGDRVRSIKESDGNWHVGKSGEVLSSCSRTMVTIRFDDANGHGWPERPGTAYDCWGMSPSCLELIGAESPETTLKPGPKLPRILIDAVPQGGFIVAAMDAEFACREYLAAFSTLPEALAFVGRTMT